MAHYRVPSLPTPLPPQGARPWIIGHRGAPARVPENTLGGFKLAIALGADGVELDVHATRDGVVVVHHDPALSDGRPIAEHDWDSLRPRPNAAGSERTAPIPRLSDVLELVKGRAVAFVELKGCDIERLVADEIRRSGARCAVHAFDHRAVRTLRSIAPELPTGVLLSSRLVDTVGAMRAAGAGTLWQEGEFVDHELVEQVGEAGGTVVAWTVNHPAELRRLVQLGVDGICTDDPGAARAAVERM